MLANLIRENFKSGVTVSLISIPLSVSLALASNASPLTGIITAIWAGLIAGFFGGSHFNIIGPTGALSGIIATYVILNGPETLPVLAMLVGVLALVSYALKLERYLILIPSSVIHGFTLGVAFIIGFGQFNAAFGLQGLPQHESFFENLLESFWHISSISWPAFFVFLIFLAGLFFFKKATPKIPGAIFLAPVGILFGYASESGFIELSVQTLGARFGEIPFKLFQGYEWNFSSSLIQTAAVVALVAILETMLSAKIADGMTRTKHNERKEMLGLGLANIASGLFGGMPATAALARTSLNVKSGANHKTSAIINAVSIAIISAFLLGYFKYIPMPVIAAILAYVAIQMVEMEHYARFWKYERSGFFISLAVAALTVIEDPIFGILVGASVSLLIFVNRLSHGYFNLHVNRFEEGMVDTAAGEKLKEIEENADVLLYSIRGKLCYINSRAHIARFEENLKKYKHIIIRLREVYFMDIDGVEALDEIIGIIQGRGQQVILTSIDSSALGLIEQMSVEYPELKKRGLIFDKTEYALRHLGIKIAPKKELNH